MGRGERFCCFGFWGRLGEFDETHVAQFVLRVVGNPDRRHAALDVYPLMFFRVAVILRICHRTTPWNRFQPLTTLAEPRFSSPACRRVSPLPAPSPSPREFPRTKPCHRPNKPAARHPDQCL